MKRLAALALVLVLFACSGPGSDSDRIKALEAEVQALKQEAGEREKVVREELARVLKNLKDIRSRIEADMSREKADDDGAELGPSDEELDAKAKTFVDENLDRLMTLTRKLLDKLDSELGNDTPPATPEPPAKGDEI